MALKYTEILNMKVAGKRFTKLSEPVEGRGNGTIVYKKPDKVVEAYYRYRNEGRDRMIFIGRLKATSTGSGFALPRIERKGSGIRSCVPGHCPC